MIPVPAVCTDRRWWQRRSPAAAPAARRASWLTVLACAVALAGCAVNGNDPALQPADAEIAGKANRAAKPTGTKVALLLPLSAGGQTSVIAKAMKQAGELALFELDDPNFELIVKDDKGTPEGARAAAEEAVAERAELILGPLFAGSVAAASPVAVKAGVPMLAFSNDRRVAARGVHILGFQADQEVERIVGYAAQQRRSRLVALLPDDDYGQTIETALGRAASGITVVAIERYGGGGGASMLEPVRRLADLIRMGSAGPSGDGTIDTMLIAAGPETLAGLGPMITFAKIDTKQVKLIGTGGWDHPGLGRDAALIGGWYPAPDPKAWQGFAEKFSRTFGMAPPRVASLAFDSVTIALGLSKGPGATRFAESSLTRPSGFNGIDGPLRLTPSGVAERRLAVLEVQSFGATTLEPANADRSGSADTN